MGHKFYGVSLTFSPAAIDTISRHLNDRNISPDYFDIIATGDLGYVGRQITEDQLKKQGFDMTKTKYVDCGEQIFDREKQDVHAGGSGCGCCASVFSSWLYTLLKSKKANRILVAATGALMSPTTCFQGEAIPGISHCIAIERIDS